MGYSARYHAFSIIAVFAALAVGIVIGAGLGDELVSGTTKNLEESLKADVRDLRAREDELGSELEREADFGVEVYPDLVGGRLRGDSVAVVALGGQPAGVADDLAGALDPTGATVERDAVVRLPPNSKRPQTSWETRVPAAWRPIPLEAESSQDCWDASSFAAERCCVTPAGRCSTNSAAMTAGLTRSC